LLLGEETVARQESLVCSRVVCLLSQCNAIGYKAT